jgi:hypothetical protein
MPEHHDQLDETNAPETRSDTTPAAPPVHAPPVNGMAVSGFILGLLSVLSIFPCGLFLSVLAIMISAPCGIIGIILSTVSRKRPGQRGLGTAGLILSICGLALSLLASVAMIVILIIAMTTQH